MADEPRGITNSERDRAARLERWSKLDKEACAPLDLLRIEDATRVQQRLIELDFFRGLRTEYGALDRAALFVAFEL
jgi:hypothetical protein